MPMPVAQERAKPDIPDALKNFDALPRAAYVRLPVVAALFNIGPATVWRWVKAGRLPPAVELGPNVTGWNVGALRESLTRDETPA